MKVMAITVLGIPSSIEQDALKQLREQIRESAAELISNVTVFFLRDLEEGGCGEELFARAEVLYAHQPSSEAVAELKQRIAACLVDFALKNVPQCVWANVTITTSAEGNHAIRDVYQIRCPDCGGRGCDGAGGECPVCKGSSNRFG